MILQFLLPNGLIEGIDIASLTLQGRLAKKTQPISYHEIQTIYDKFQSIIKKLGGSSHSILSPLEEDAFLNIIYIKEQYDDYVYLSNSKPSAQQNTRPVSSEDVLMPKETNHSFVAPSYSIPSNFSAFSIYTPRTSPNPINTSSSSGSKETKQMSLGDRNGFFSSPEFKTESRTSTPPTGTNTTMSSGRSSIDTTNPVVTDETMASTIAPNPNLNYSLGFYTPLSEKSEQLDESYTSSPSPI